MDLIHLGTAIFTNLFNCFNTFLNKPRILHVCNTSILKTLWEKEKLLVIFCPIIMKCGENGLLDEIWDKYENGSNRVKN